MTIKEPNTKRVSRQLIGRGKNDTLRPLELASSLCILSADVGLTKGRVGEI